MIIYGFMCDKIGHIDSIYEFDENNLDEIINRCNIDKTTLVGYSNCDKKQKHFDVLKQNTK